MELVHVCMPPPDAERPWRLESYEGRGGYRVWRRVLAGELDAGRVLETVKASGLRGRGGAGFPTGLKWSFMPGDCEQPTYLVCNSDESEPGTCHDRDILRYNPHVLIEGMALAAFAMGATVSYNYIRGEFLGEPVPRFLDALDEARAAGLIGRGLGSAGIDFELHPFVGAGAYICGEETGLLESLEGKPGKPRFKPPFPAQSGLYGRPTTVNNTQTLACVPAIVEKGAEWFKSLGPPNSAGTMIYSVSGHVERPGNYEAPLGVSFNELLEHAGGVWKGRELKAVIPGGSSVPVLPAAIIRECTMDYDSLSEAGSALGTGAMIVMDDRTCMVSVLRRIARFYYAESCGQCTPCREGTGWLYRMLTRMLEGRANVSDLDLLLSVANNIEGHTICALGDAAAWPVQSFLKHFRGEFEAKIRSSRAVARQREAAYA
ncbi:MAG: NADH-quinone oxidoreductase subunit NuoF [Gammaproteobacteria bacterium]|nr:NADH-quinone oxidoreductase subunit NuoF [Gammaproteobacteria bacterium]MDE0414129.1 NADH-quinone oxidoreductase subunit NuoF [Gammaproteobacteria bacterium]